MKNKGSIQWLREEKFLTVFKWSLELERNPIKAFINARRLINIAKNFQD